MVEVREGISIG